MNRVRSRLGGTIVALALSALLCAADAQRAVGVRPEPKTPEAGLWAISDKAENEARRSAELNSSAELREYVRGIACKVGGAHCPEIRVYVFDRPFFNAQMAPNGYMEVWSGLLLRAESEAELAFVLGHETGHYIGNDSAQALQATKSRATGALVFAALLGVAATAASYNATSPQQVNSINNSTQGLINAVYLGTVASLFSFDRQQETDADAFGFNAATNAGFDPTAGVSLWQRMIDEASSSDFQKVRNGTARTSVFDSHPVEADRVAAMKKLAGDKKGGESGKERYRATIRPFLNAWLRDDLRRRDFGETLFIIDRLAATKEDLGVLSFYRGETLRLRRKDGDAAKAEEAYRDAIRYDDAPAETWRQLADYSERRSENAEAARLLQAYLAKAPNASDAAFARMRLDRALGQSAAAPTSSAPAPAAPTPTTPSTPPAEPPASTVAVAATTLETPKAAGIAP